MEGIIIASFGSTYQEAYDKSIGSLAEEIRQAYPNHMVLESYSSEVVRRILQRRGVETLNFSLALEEMKKAGVSKVKTLMLYIIDGVEYEKVQKQGEAYGDTIDISYSQPLLAQNQHDRLAKTMVSIFNKPTVLMGHGSYHHSDIYYKNFQQVLDKGEEKFFVGTLEGDLEIEQILKGLEKCGQREIILTPFLLMAGDHAHNDMADIKDEDSWYSILQEAGYKVHIQLKGLCERPEIKEVFKENLETLM